MKRQLLILASLLGLASMAMATGFDVNKASFTLTADTLKRIPGTEKGSILFGVVVATRTTGVSMNVYDSQMSATKQILAIDLSLNQAMPDFSIIVSSGITYTISGANNGVTILWR